MAGKGRSGRGGVCRSGGTRSRAAELFSTKKTCPQERLRVLSYRATLDVPIATVRTISGWLTAHRRAYDIRPHQRACTTWGQAVLVLRWLKDGTDVRTLARDAGVSQATGYRYPLPCWWSRVVRGWASCCGHDVLPLSADDPGGVVTRGSRALVTADKGNGPLRVRSFVTWVRDRSSTG